MKAWWVEHEPIVHSCNSTSRPCIMCPHTIGGPTNLEHGRTRDNGQDGNEYVPMDSGYPYPHM
jgi:hypothetical protein